MKRLVCAFVCVALLMPLLVRAQPTQEDEREAAKAASAWLELLDAGRVGESWEQMSPFVKNSVSKADWEQVLPNVREILGKVHNRRPMASERIGSLPGMPDGDYVVLRFLSHCEKKAEAVETMIMCKDNDGSWRAATYVFR